MRAVQVMAPGKTEIIDIPTPQMAAGKVFTRTLLASICGSDWPVVTHDRGDVKYPLAPGMPGHEVVAVVEQSDAPGFEQGDIVLDVGYDGSFREFQVREPEHLLKLPSDKPMDEMLMTQPLGAVIHGLRKWRTTVMGQTVVVIGQGTIGQFWTALIKMQGATRIIGLDLEDGRLALGRKMGATHQVNPSKSNAIEAVMDLTGGEGADMVVEAVGSETTYNWAAPMVRRGGSITFYGLPKKAVTPLDFVTLMRKDPTLYTSIRGEKDADFAAARELIASGRVYVKPLLTHRMPIAKVYQAHELAESRADNVMKVILEF
ncbi:MAG: zinc-binding dehydrogenase [Chloroflexota bacterium]